MATVTVIGIDPDDYNAEDRGYSTPCFVWKGRTQGAGKYPVLFNRRLSTWANGDYPAHKLAWEIVNGPMAPGLVPDHLCGVHLCVRSDHIIAVTSQQNVLRSNTPAARNKAKTHCPQGHEYSEENTYIKPNGGRVCITCNRIGRKK